MILKSLLCHIIYPFNITDNNNLIVIFDDENVMAAFILDKLK